MAERPVAKTVLILNVAALPLYMVKTLSTKGLQSQVLAVKDFGRDRKSPDKLFLKGYCSMPFSKISTSSVAFAAFFTMSAVLLPGSAFAAEEPAKDAIIAVVDGEELRQSDLEMMMRELPPAVRMMPMDRLYDQLVRRLVDRRLMAKAATDLKLDQSEKLQRYVSFLKEGALQEAMVRDLIEKQVTEESLKKQYEKLVAGMPAQEEAHARHILVEKEEEAKDLIQKLEKGADFIELAKEHSTGPSGENGGDLGYFTADQMVPEFSEATFALEKGAISKAPVKTQFGWHIIKLEDKRKAEKPSYEQMAVELESDAASKAITEMARDLREKSEIKLFDLEGKEMPFYPKEEAGTPPETKK